MSEFGPGELELVGMVFNGVPVEDLAAVFYAGIEWDKLSVRYKGAFLEYQRWKFGRWVAGER